MYVWICMYISNSNLSGTHSCRVFAQWVISSQRAKITSFGPASLHHNTANILIHKYLCTRTGAKNNILWPTLKPDINRFLTLHSLGSSDLLLQVRGIRKRIVCLSEKNALDIIFKKGDIKSRGHWEIVIFAQRWNQKRYLIREKRTRNKKYINTAESRKCLEGSGILQAVSVIYLPCQNPTPWFLKKKKIAHRDWKRWLIILESISTILFLSAKVSFGHCMAGGLGLLFPVLVLQ